jgi:hypothetical protein
MTYGQYYRTQPRVRVLRGYGGNETTTLKFSAPPNASATIYSGQVISLDTNNTWVLGCPNGKTPYIAFQDGADTDVVSSGLLLGLSCAGPYEIQTAYYVRTDGNFAVNDAPLIASTGTPGSLTLAVTPGGGSTPEQALADIIGMTSSGGEIQVGSVLNGAGAYVPGTNSETAPSAAGTFMLQFTTGISRHRSIAA